eukprot:COSAG01_NODE_277_length_19582_cov_28.126726_21_plen_78_part_00
MYVLGADITDQHITNCNSGMLFSPEFNTVKGLNCRLLSPHDLYDDNFDLSSWSRKVASRKKERAGGPAGVDDSNPQS